MKLTFLLDKIREAIDKHGNLDAKLEIIDHGSMEQLEITTTFVDHAESGEAIAFLITAMIDD